MTGLHRVRHAALRARQTFTHFDNPGQLLGRAALSRVGKRDGDLEFRRGTVHLFAPPSRGAIFPIYEVFAEDTYRFGWFTAGLGSSPHVLDIGAHVGSFSLAIAELLPESRVDAYEASPTTAAYLQRNVAASNVGSRVSAHAEAIAESPGFIEFSDTADCSPLNGISARFAGPRIQVPSITLAEAFARLGSVDLVKIDAEGVEYEIVLTSPPDLWHGVRRVVMEYHEVAGHSKDELIAYFAAVGLHVIENEPMAGNPLEGLLWLSSDPLPTPEAR